MDYLAKTGINHGCTVGEPHGCRHEAGEVIPDGHLTEASVVALGAALGALPRPQAYVVADPDDSATRPRRRGNTKE